MVAAMMQQQEGAVQIQSTIAHVELIGEDGKSVPAAVVLRDKDLDLAFIRPLEKRAEPWPFVELKRDAAIEAFDEVIIPYRLGRVAGRLCTATIVRALGTLQKPRKLYVLGDWVAQEMGGAAFNLAGEAAGIVVLRRIKDARTPPAMPMANEADPNVSAVVVPAAAVLDSAAQAPHSVAATPAPAAAKDDNTITIQPERAGGKSDSDAVVIPSSAAGAPKP
jgi:hypothetical protein